MILGQVFVARQRSSSPADLRPRALVGPVFPPENAFAADFVGIGGAVGQREAEIESHLPAGDVRHRAVPHDSSRFILIESEIDESADEIAGLRAALADGVGDFSRDADWAFRRRPLARAGRRKRCRASRQNPTPRTSGSFAVNTS